MARENSLRSYNCACLWLAFLWMCVVNFEAHGFPRPDTVLVSKARCYARCLRMTRRDFHGNSNYPECNSDECQECIIPCGRSYSSLDECTRTCGQSSGCKDSCRYLVITIKSFLSIYKENGSNTSQAGVPKVLDKTFTSISLAWKPPSDAPFPVVVYLLGMAMSGDIHSFFYLHKIFTSPEAVLKDISLCSSVTKPPWRISYDGIYYRFHVVTVTEKGILSHGPESPKTMLPRPDPVTDIEIGNFVYDQGSYGDKLLLTASWKASLAQKQLITNYGMFWIPSFECYGSGIPRLNETSTPEPTGMIHIYEKQKRQNCRHSLVVYAMIGCSVSEGTTLMYPYPGCTTVKNFPREMCYEFDPPTPGPGEDVVRNLTITILSSERSLTVGWEPPSYPYKRVSFYLLRWAQAESGYYIKSWKNAVLFDTLATLTGLQPQTSYIIEVKPYFGNFFGKPVTQIFATTPPLSGR